MAFSERRIPSKCHMSSPWAVRAMATSEIDSKSGYLLIISTQEGKRSSGDSWPRWMLGKDTPGFEEAVWITGDRISRQTEVCFTQPPSLETNPRLYLAPSHPGRADRADP